jgi:hypothetical protein
MKPEQHYESGMNLLKCIEDNASDLNFDTPQALVLATAANAQANLGLLKFLINIGPYAFLPSSGG